ncbi:EAL domain-containing protein [Chromobacterium sp. IIBBL 290-4]|uniref:EAL domain-containing response regulator n=1 Tax=Chromobacterium sp. IIBBL 290-4 TaxID=2953890 RepID=UPI0020B74DA1|nr:EAL domain-containing response regulator [Chromobacterium sp. IIBBL 290-4]UTH73259.1 EAL domain-containing response regulator [Chromobacterium sp. IIBBL 290-4]
MLYLEQWRGKSVMVVEDSASHRLLAVGILQALGFAPVYEAENGVDALDKLSKLRRVDLVVTDLNMPMMDGVKLLENIAARLRGKVRFVAVMSGVPRDVLDTVQGVVDASELDLLAVFPKPLKQEEVERVLDGNNPEWQLEGPAGAARSISLGEVEEGVRLRQLVPYFQPKVSIKDNKLFGMEALARWEHPQWGVLSPAVFVHHLEEGELALRFFYQFLRDVCASMKRFLAEMPGLHASVNLPVPLLNDPNLVDEMTTIIQSSGLPNDSIVLEVTETTLMSNLAASLGTLARLRLNGFGLAMDDYGTGYSSMKQLSRSPFTELKIDREFVHDAASSPKKLAILTSAVAMCQKLQLLSVAEGVETEADWQQLAALGCDVAQGYYHSRPLSAEMFLQWMRESGHL